jgi:hypothetical protein
MKAPPREVPVDVREADRDLTTGADVRVWFLWGAGAGLVALLIMGFYLWIYHARGITVPMGWDTSRYIWRTNLGQQFGVAHLQQHVQAGVQADNGRPAFPVLAGMLSSLGPSTFRLAAVIPIAAAASIGLAAAAFIGATLRRPAWEMALVALGVGTSSLMTRLLGPETYQDNLMAGAVFLAAAIAITMSVQDRRAIISALILFGMVELIHWAFFVFLSIAILLTAALYLPASWRRWRRKELALWDTPTARLTAVVAGAAAAGAISIFGVLGGVTRPPAVSRSEFLKKLRQDLPLYRFPILLPAAAVGAVSLGLSTRRPGEPSVIRERIRLVLAFLLSWSAVTLAGYLAYRVLHLLVPAHRFLAFALALPILAMVAVVWLARQAARVAGRIVAVLLALALLAYPAFLSHRQWFSTPAWMDPVKIHQATTTAAYLDATRVAPGRPVVFIVQSGDRNYIVLMGHMIRASLPANRMQDVYLYVGSPENYLADQPTLNSPRISQHFLQLMEGTYSRNPVAVMLEAFNDTFFSAWKAAHPESLVEPDIAVVRGPPPPAAFAAPPSPVGQYSSFKLGGLAVMTLVLLWLVGMGWALALLGPWLRTMDLMAAAPAVGIGALVLGGAILDRAGLRLRGTTGVIALAVVLAAGWGLFALRSRRRPPTNEDSARHSPIS